jgi:uncharacterized membrane protein YkoI
MKINRFFAFAAIALLVVAAMGAVSMKVIAMSNHASTAQTEACDKQDDSAEVEDAETADDAPGCNDQNEGQDETDAPDPQDEVVTGNPAITVEAAQKAAESYLNAGTATQVELDKSDQDGKLIYSVEIGDTDVSVDAMTGEVLGTVPSED